MNCKKLEQFWSSREFASFEPPHKHNEDHISEVVTRRGKTKFFESDVTTIMTEEVRYSSSNLFYFHKKKSAFTAEHTWTYFQFMPDPKMALLCLNGICNSIEVCHLALVVLPDDPFWEMEVRNNFAETQQLGHAPMSGSEI